MGETRHIDDIALCYNSVTDLYTWTKGKNLKLSNNFNTYEFECKCDYQDCKEQKLRKGLVFKIQKLRDQIGEPVRINSGYRCEQYQDKLRKKGLKTAKKISQHSLGAAVDVQLARNGGRDLDKRFNNFKLICEALFKAIGYGKGWLHVDLRNERRRRWTY